MQTGLGDRNIMRDFKGMKRQRGRNRNAGNKPQQHNANRAYDSNGPEGIKVRGAAQSVFEKYQQLARDATTSGDRVLAENYLQHAEHYFRLIRAIQPNRPVTDIIGRDQLGSGMDIDFEAEHEEPTEAQIAEATENKPESEDGEERPRFENRQNRDRDDRPRDRDGYQGNRQNNQNRDRDDRPRDRDRWRDRDDRQRDGQQQQSRDDRPRDDRPRDDRPRDDRPREDRFRDRDDRPRDRDRDQPRDAQQQQPRDEAPREDRPREEREPRRSRYERDRPREERAEAREARDPLQVIEPQSTPMTAAPLAPEPKRASPRLRGQDGAVSELPGFLSRSAPAPEAAEEAPAKPKRRRAPKSFEGEAPKSDDEG